MELFDVYSLFDVTPVKAQGCRVWDEKGTEYLDLYGGHAVISVGHSHPHYVAALTEQLGRIGCYYNNHRVQRNLGILTPMEKYRLYLAA